MATSYIRPGDNADITKERRTCTFDTEALTRVIYDGKIDVDRKRFISQQIANDPEFAYPRPAALMSRVERSEHAAKLAKRVAEVAPATTTPPTELSLYLREGASIEGYPTSLHFSMFIPALQGQADDEQRERFLMPALRLEIVGTFAQTELGHGTNVRELETTATFDGARDEFVLSTPTISSLKWWPGNLGKSSTHVVLIAQLVVDGRRLGTHSFFVHIRDTHTGRPLPGIELGDIGPKVGFNAVDNGFMRLSNVRIPRTNMLMKHAKLTRDGTYTKPLHAKIGYGPMVHVRSLMIWANGMHLAQAATIAVRYSAIRRQGKIDESAREVQILDYQTQQHRLFPQIARAYAFSFAGNELLQLYEETLRQISQGKVDLLTDLHSLSTGLKAVVTHQVSLGIEQCRMACGGHGFSAASALPAIYGVQVAGCTYEGENMVMLQQAARSLLKVVSAPTGTPLSTATAYLGCVEKPGARSRIGDHSLDGKDEIDEMLKTLEHATRRVVRESAAAARSAQAGRTPAAASNAAAVELTRAARLHARLFVAKAFSRKVVALKDSSSSPPSVHAVLADLLRLFLRYELVDMSHHLLEDGYVNGAQIKYLKKGMYDDLEKLRPNAVSLVDAWDFSERELLFSVLGRRDGNVYDALYEWAKQSDLNKEEVHPGFHKYLKPMMENGRRLGSKI